VRGRYDWYQEVGGGGRLVSQRGEQTCQKEGAPRLVSNREREKSYQQKGTALLSARGAVRLVFKRKSRVVTKREEQTCQHKREREQNCQQKGRADIIA
jgi:hypothetical protein